MNSIWKCSKCRRAFAQKNQRHACGTGDRKDVLRNRPASLVKIYGEIESYAKSLGEVEFVTRERYVLFRTVRIFADLVVMKDALRLAIHLGRQVDDAMFFKVVSDRQKFTHVVKLHAAKDVRAIKPFLKEAYAFSLSKPKKRG